MTATIQKLVIGGVEVPVDLAEEQVFRVIEQAESIERAEAMDYIMSTSSSCSAPFDALPSAPLSRGAIRAMNSVLRSRVNEAAILRDDGDI